MWRTDWKTLFAAIVVIVAMAAGMHGVRAAPPTYTIEIKDHRFVPEELEIPAGTKVKLIIKNLDPTPEEFESYDLNREKVIGGGRQRVIFIGPLKPGTYGFFGEFNPDTAQGRIIVK